MSSVIHADEGTFEKVPNQTPQYWSIFGATWCGPCKAIAPLDELSSEYEGKARIVKIDVDQNPNLAAQYGIRSIPTLFMFKTVKKWMPLWVCNQSPIDCPYQQTPINRP